MDLSDLAGKGVFSKWNHKVAWPGGIDLCPDALYVEVTGKDITSFLTASASKVL